MSEIIVKNNEKKLQFEVEQDGALAVLEYRWYKGTVALMHTLVPSPLEGKGIGSALVKTALEHAKAKKLKIMVYCPYVSSYMKRHPEYDGLLDKQYYQ